MALIDVIEHVPKHGTDLVALPHPLEHDNLVKVATQTTHNHLQFDTGRDLAAESAVREIAFEWVGIAVRNAAGEL